MMEQPNPVMGRRTARALLFDDDGRLLLFKRIKPDQEPYWSTPGGGVELTDASVEAALHRELAEELGAVATGASQVFLVSAPAETGIRVHHYFAARLVSLDLASRSGLEFDDPLRGHYELERYGLLDDQLADVDLRPPALKEFVLANREALLTEAGLTVEVDRTPTA